MPLEGHPFPIDVDHGIHLVVAIHSRAKPAIETGVRRLARIASSGPFSDKGGFIARLLEEHRIGFQELGMSLWSRVLIAAIRMGILPSHQAAAARPAKRRHYERVLHQHAFSGNPIDMRRIHEWMTRNSQSIPTQFVDIDDDHIRSIRCVSEMRSDKQDQSEGGKSVVNITW